MDGTDVQRAMEFARTAHAAQRYADQPYVVHLASVVRVLDDFGYDTPEWACAGWLHDVIEDTKTTADDLVAHFGADVSALVWAVTGVGANRRERNSDIYDKIDRLPKAAVLKLADRIANVEASAGTPFASMYAKEMPVFEATIRPHVPPHMWGRLLRAVQIPQQGGQEP